MSDFQLTTAVALICFNRPPETSRVMETLRHARPPRLYVIADAPRPGVEGEAALCAEVRAIISAVDWPCELVTDFADANMGCRDRVISGLSRAFKTEESLIILEDDCVAHPDFFRFCQELLSRYRGNNKIFAISGDNFQKTSPFDESYYFSRIFHCWGWATWRDRWEAIDFSMAQWPRLRESTWLTQSLGTPVAAEIYRHAFDQTYDGRNSSWAYRASFESLVGGRMNINPRANLVTNIGLGPGATHTKSSTGQEGRAAAGLGFPLVHPTLIAINETADRNSFNYMAGSWHRRMKIQLKHFMRSFLPGNAKW